MSTPITIAVDVSCLCARPLTGVGYYTLHLFRALASESPECRLRFFASSARGPRLAEDALGALGESMRCVHWPSRLKHALWTRLEWPPIEWFTGPADIAHGGFHLLPAARGAKRVVTIFDLSGLRCAGTRRESNLAMHLRLLRHAAARADGIIVISQSCRNDVIELLRAPEDRLHVVYGGVFLDEFAGELDLGRLGAVKAAHGIRGEYLIHLGTLEPRKNLPRLIRAYDRVRRMLACPPQLVLAGSAGWMYEDIFETIRASGLEGLAVHTGYLSREDAVLLLRGARACVYPSLYEGFGLPVLEAMAARTPVLTSNVSSLPEVVGACGVLVDPHSEDAIADGLARLLDNEAAAAARAEAGYARAAAFTWQASARALAGVYQSLSAGGHRA